MEANAVPKSTPPGQSSPAPAALASHVELIAASLCGLFILAGWILSKSEYQLPALALFLLSYLTGGYSKAKEGIEGTIKNRELNVELLMILAAAGSAFIGYWIEGAILIFIFALSGALETYTMNKSRREINALMNIQPEKATRLRHEIEESVHVTDLTVGDVILVKPGERIPSDGFILRGETTIDQAAITGESIPVIKSPQTEVFAGTVNLKSAITVQITKEAGDTLFHKIIQLVQSAQSEKSPSQLFIEKFEGTYVKVVIMTVLIMMFLPHYMLGWSWTETFYRAMILLVVASPCALVASIMPASLSAISNGAKKGILFKGSIHLENLGHLKAIAFDKTGTLTKGKPEVTDVLVREDVAYIDFLKIVASIERQSNHPLAQAIVDYAKNRLNNSLFRPDYLEAIPGWGVVGSVNEEKWKVGKAEFIGREEALSFRNGVAAKLAGEGKTIVFARDTKGITGIIALKDIIRQESVSAIEHLSDLGIYTILLTGDGKQTAEAIAAECHVNEYVADCLPEEKVRRIKDLKKKFKTVAMVGDGINDAPALATAHVGIAMGEGTDVALETADIVLMKNDLSRIAEAMELSKRMTQIIKQNIIFSIIVIILLICSNFLQIIDLPYGVIGHEGSTILVILNGLRLLK